MAAVGELSFVLKESKINSKIRPLRPIRIRNVDRFQDTIRQYIEITWIFLASFIWIDLELQP